MTLRTSIFVLLFFCSYLEIISSAKILAVYPSQSYSHFRAFQPLLEELIRRGHNLTLISCISLSDELEKKYTHVNIEKYYRLSSIGVHAEELFEKNPLQEILIINYFNAAQYENVLKYPEVQEIIHSGTDFDLIICELFMSTDIFFGLAKKFNAPVISTTSQWLLSHHNWILGNPDSFHFPNSFLKATEKMSVVLRVVNMGFNIISTLLYEFYFLPQYQISIEKYFGFEKENLPSIKEIMKNISVSLVNSHHSLAYAKPELPNVVNVGGIHFTYPKPLPEHLQTFMNEAEHGVIYVSFGSILDVGTLSQLGLTLIDILKTLPQRIVMKWDRKLLPHVPNNIFTGEWFSQPDILNHPNCRLFITHGGYLSLLESLNASVPVIGIPFFGDQHFNLGIVEYFELGMKTELNNAPSELPGKIDEVLKNPKYKNNMQQRSLLFRNRLASPLDTAMYWVDHVLKHKDTSHLKPASVRLTWYEFYSLDVLGVLLILFYILKFILMKFVSLVLLLSRKTRAWFLMKSGQRCAKIDSKCD